MSVQVMAYLYDERGLPLLTEEGEEFVVPWTGAMPARSECVLLRGEHPDVNDRMFTVVPANDDWRLQAWMRRPTRGVPKVLILKRLPRDEQAERDCRGE